MLVLTSCRVVVYPVYDTYQLCCQSLRFQNQPPLTWWVPTTTSSSSLSTSDGTILLQVATHSLPLLLLIFNFYTFYFTRGGFRKYGWQLKTIFSHASVTIIIIIHTYLYISVITFFQKYGVIQCEMGEVSTAHKKFELFWYFKKNLKKNNHSNVYLGRYV